MVRSSYDNTFILTNLREFYPANMTLHLVVVCIIIEERGFKGGFVDGRDREDLDF
jgi:hypothetical protein